MVGPARRMEELPRSMALGRFCGLLRNPLCAVPPEHERGFEPMAKRKREHSEEGYARARSGFSGSHLDGAADSIIRIRWPRISGSRIFEGRVCAAHVADPAERPTQPGPRPPIQKHDAGLLQDLR